MMFCYVNKIVKMHDDKTVIIMLVLMLKHELIRFFKTKIPIDGIFELIFFLFHCKLYMAIKLFMPRFVTH